MTGRVGVRELKQNASAVVRRSHGGEVITITEHGRPVAQMTPIPESPLDRLVSAGLARPPLTDHADLPPPDEGAPITPALLAMRDAERY